MKTEIRRLNDPPLLSGYTYHPEEAYRARDDGRLLAIRLETNNTCNLRCRYCYAEPSERGLVADYEALRDIVDSAGSLGARSVVIIGGGEPTIHPRFRDLVSHVASLRMTPVVFTNGVEMTAELARFLYGAGASVMAKLDSMKPELQDYLAGVPGSFERIGWGLEHLMEAGLNEPAPDGRLRLGLSFVLSRLNVEEMEFIWHFCRLTNIFPNMEVLTPTGRALHLLKDQGLDASTIQRRKLRLLEIDRKHYGFDWLPYTPLAASGCLQHLYSMYVTVSGDVRPCAPTKFDEHPDLLVGGVYPHNVRRRNLADIYTDPLFEYVRNIDRHLEGRCSGCENLDQCIGCRGYAYSIGVAAGLDPRAALRQECAQCFRKDEAVEGHGEAGVAEQDGNRRAASGVST